MSAVNTALYFAYRAARNPTKYFNREFLKTNGKEALTRSRMGRLYGVPYIIKSARTRKSRRVAFFPSPINVFYPGYLYVAWKTLMMCGAQICNADCTNSDLAIAWHPSARYDLDPDTLRRFQSRHAVLNARCTDIRKTVVDRTFYDVFGYALNVDPRTYKGTILRKSDLNGLHHITLMDGPLETIEDGFVYQRLVGSETSNGIGEYRVNIVAGKVAAVYVNYRPASNRFQTLASHSEYCSVADAFSDNEREQIQEFTRRMGLDFGGLDVLRDSDGRIYICDCNNTPTGPGKKLATADQVRVIRETAEAFEAAYFL